ncbi:NAD(P)/FAD-dependent oxidoreductase [Microbacterium sp. HD4P20]|uniref:bifunctional NAD(P)/FAD-dependent oxidoreductase/class I SAM-dependent methyltransferase n=1 Tax=Microbacterium sp. HD4P20 TaxID=2864874 RepID=UPI001C63DED4|nr:bifunctional NAD(P)/FAD-dependent oxidoreductase/class I SAM-dependent methyltransferase [Microbacterium sp. HD4P20]MCP2636267.1 NAD(P)/FAD-dependent oxidoreductase [Microbacterium sp. HD4P20]
MTNEWDAVIIGGGVAGLSAAQMLGRSRRRTLVIDGGQPRNRFAAHMHGVLGHDGRDPGELLETGRAEARAYGVEIVAGAVTSLTEDGDVMRIRRSDGTIETARAVVIATGIRDELPDVPGLEGEWGRTVLHCPYCHGWEVAGKRLGVLATSPASAHQIQLVRQLSEDVTAFTAAAEPLEEDEVTRFTARGIRLVSSPVSEVRHTEDGLVVVTRDGDSHVVDALFTGGTPTLELDFAADLNLARTDMPGGPLAVDMLGATSHPRVFAAGNVTSPFGNVPISMGAGSMAGAGVNAMLVAEDFRRAVAERTALRNAGWEERYAEKDRFWSGRVNAAVAAIVADLAPGTALDIGSGEGGDVVWLAEHGWRATGIDVSATAVRRAAEFAATRGVDARFVVADGAASVEGEFDLVLASFLHSWEPDFPRIGILREAAERVAPNGHLLVVSHAAPPSWVHELPEHMPPMRSPEAELALLNLDTARWRPEIVEIRRREATTPDGAPAHLDDGVLLLRRVE